MFQSSVKMSLAFFVLSFIFIHCSNKQSDHQNQTVPEAVLALGSGGGGSAVEPGAPAENGPVTVPGGTGGPGDPINAPVLMNPKIVTFDANPVDDPYGSRGLFFINDIKFQQPVHNQTVVTAFIGSRSMTQLSDGTVVHSYGHYSLNADAAQAVGFHFLQTADIKLKILIVAKNEYGVSIKEFKISHARACAGVPKPPTSTGNCGDFCVQGGVTGDIMDLKATYNLPDQGYIYLDINALSPRGSGLSLNALRYLENTEATPGVYSVTSTLDAGKENAFICVLVMSALITSNDFQILQVKIRNE